MIDPGSAQVTADAELHMPAPYWPNRECRYMGTRWQWVIGSRQVALWRGDLANVFGQTRTIFNLRIEDAWRALTGKDER